MEKHLDSLIAKGQNALTIDKNASKRSMSVGIDD